MMERVRKLTIFIIIISVFIISITSGAAVVAPYPPSGITGVGTNMTMNLTPNMTAGANGLDNMTMNMTPNMTANMTAGADGLDNMTMNMTANMTAGTNGLDNMTMNMTPNMTANMTAGEQGINGINGISATVAVNYTFTGLPGTEANVTNVGNETVALFDVTIPQGLTGATGATGATGGTGGQILYFRHAASTDPITYETLYPIPAGSAEDDENVSVTSAGGETLVDAYITDIGYPAITQIPAGLWRFRTFHYVNLNSGVTKAVFKVYNRSAGGTETLLFSVDSDEINQEATPDEYLTSYVQTTAYQVSLTDRIVVKVYGKTTSSSTRIFHFVYEGSTHTSHIQTVLESAPATSLSFSVIAGETLYKGEAVYISGASGGNPLVLTADNTNTAKSRVVGLMTADTASGAVGQVRRSGALTSVDTRNTSININPLGQTWAAGDLLFATTGGGLTNTRPTSGRSVKAGYSLLGSNATDVILVYPMENPVWSTAASGENVIARLGDLVGVTKFSIRGYTNTEVAYINSLGLANFNGTNETANITMNNNYITGLMSGSSNGSVVNKSYVDSKSSTPATLTSCTNLTAMYPIGSVYVSTLPTDPKTTFGCGCWTSVGTGYYLVSV